MARKQVTSSKGRQLKVQQLLIPEIEKLQQHELQAQLPLTINKPIKQIPPQVKIPSQTTNKTSVDINMVSEG